MSDIVRRQNGLAVPSDPIALGNVLAASGFFQDSRGAAQAAVKVMAGQELGFGPIASMTGVHIVKGRVTISANLIAAAIKRHPSYSYLIVEHTTEKCSIDFLEGAEVIGNSTFSMEDARTAGLATGDNYRKFAKNMLFARSMSNGAKWFCPDVFGGSPIYTPDELGAEVDGETGEVVSAPIYTPEPEPVVAAESVAELKAAAAGRTGAQIKMAFGACGLTMPPAGAVAPGQIFDAVPASKAAELALALAGGDS